MLYIEGKFEANTTIKLMDVSGKLLKTNITNENKAQVDLSNLENGLYFIEVNSGNEKATYRAIKE
ncbi:MAG: T9SS type A sorting domain-containing protein [Bacteroidales bacterium]|nr:T9SS type A sorting domain-containing protein [Bacteroidales bacterium]